MIGFTQFFIEFTRAGMVNILKYVLGVDDAVRPRSLAFVPDCLKTEGLCIKAVRRNPYALRIVPDVGKSR